MGNKGSKKKDQPILETKHNDHMTFREYSNHLKEQGFDISQFKYKEWTKDEKTAYWDEAYGRAYCNEAQEHSLDWLFQKGYWQSCTRKYYLEMIEIHAKKQLQEYCKL